MIYNNSFVKGKKVKLKESTNERQSGWQKQLLSLWIRETRGVYLWICMTIATRAMIRFLYDLSAYRTTKTLPEYFWYYTLGNNRDGFSSMKQAMLTILSLFSRRALSLMPSKVLTLQSPGFIFANPIILLWIRDKTCVTPNVPIRASDYVLGRIRLAEFVVILPVHVMIPLLLSAFLRRVLPNGMIPIALGAVKYAEGATPWIVDFFSEMLITALFTVALQVLPVLFQLNHLPRWCLVWLFFPIFNFSVDSNGMGSTFSPNSLLTFGLMGDSALWMRSITSILGGMIGGKIMQAYFPDDKPFAADR